MRYAFALILSVLCTISVLAAQTPAREPAVPQQPAEQQPAKPAAPAAQVASANKVTYTGCLKPGTTPDSWMLENAEIASAAGISAKSSTPTGTAGTAGSKLTLGLTAKPTENLKPHANHKIEVVGTVSPVTGAKVSGEAARQNLTVESFKMVSAACP